MTKLTYNRPYQYVEDLRLFGCYRSKDHTVFVGQGFADNTIAFVENNGMLTQLESSGKVQHGDYDQLVTQRFDVDMPFRIYVVNPDDENGKASNAIEYTPSKDIPVLDVLVNGESVVKDQKAYIDISKKLDSIMKPNMIYGTDSDGKETQFKRQQIEGVQHFFLNGDEIPLDLGNIRITDIARESKSVQRVSEPLQLYGTNEQGAQATYPKSFFATSEAVINAEDDIKNLKANKQDKDTAAKDGYIAIMKGGQSIGSSTSLDETLKKISDTAQELTDLTDTVKRISVKDWKSKDKDSRIENNPIGDASIVITDKSVDDEQPFRSTDHAVVYGLNPQPVGQYGTMVGSGNQANQYGTTVGSYSSAKGDSSTAIGSQSQADGDHASAFGIFASAQKTNSVAIGKGAAASADNATAIGPDSTADVANAVSIGFETSDSTLKPQYRRLMAVDDPILDHDAANKKYVDSHSGSSSSSGSDEEAFSPIANRYFLPSLGNVDKWTFSSDPAPTSGSDDIFDFLPMDDACHANGFSTVPDNWETSKMGAGVINIPVGGESARLISRNLNILDDDVYRIKFAIAGSFDMPTISTVSVDMVFNGDMSTAKNIDKFQGADIAKRFIYVDKKISIKNLIGTTSATVPMTKQIVITVTNAVQDRFRVLITDFVLRNMTAEGVSNFYFSGNSPYLDPDTLIQNRYFLPSTGNLDGWAEQEYGETTWTAPNIVGSLPTGFKVPENPKYAGFMQLSKRECMANAVHVDPYDTYLISCLVAVDSNFISSKKIFNIGYCVDVSPTPNGANSTSKWFDIVTVPSTSFTAGEFIRVEGKFTVPANATGYVNFRPRFFINPGKGGAYVTDLNIKKVADSSQRISIKMPYFDGKAGIFTRIGGFVHVQVSYKYTGANSVPNNVAATEKVPAGFRPGVGFLGVLNMVSDEGYTIRMELTPDGNMVVSGQLKSNQKYSGSTIYPVMDRADLPTTM